jgi:uncharacterized protein (TIRG00374 family)
MNINGIVQLFAEVSPIFLMLTLFVILLTVIIQAARYKLIIKHFFNGHISLIDSFLVNCGAQLSSYIAPFKAGIAIAKPYLTKRYSNMTFKKSFLAIAFEQFFELGWQISILPFLLYFIGEKFLIRNSLVSIIFFVLLILIVFFCILNYKKIIKFLIGFIEYMPKKLRKRLSKAEITEKSLNKEMQRFIGALFHWKLFIEITLITLPLILLSPLIIIFIAFSFKIIISYKLAFLAYWLSMIVGKLSGLPGGIGTRDLTLMGVLTTSGIDLSLTLSITILYRLLAVVFFIITGAPTLMKIGGRLVIKAYHKSRTK